MDVRYSLFAVFCGSSLVSLEVFCSAQILLIVQITIIRHSVFFFVLFLYISSFWNLEICSYRFHLSFPVFFFCSLSCPPFYSFLFFFLFPVLFCFLCLFTLFSGLPFCFLFKSAILSFSLFLLLYSICFSLIFYYYSIYSLSIILHRFRSLYLILLCYLFCS